MEKLKEQKLMAKNLLSGAARHDVNAVKNLLKKVSANVQNDEDGFTPLHAAVAAAATVSSSSTEQLPSISRDEATAEIVRILFENGAIWNDLDRNDETPGCIAYRFGLKKTYQSIVDAGIRAELLLSRLDSVEDETEGEDDGLIQAADKREHEETSDQAASDITASATTKDEETVGLTEMQTSLAYKNQNAVSKQHPPPDDYIDHWNSNAAFLRSTLRYTDTTLLDHSSNAVMMDWETEIMNRHAETLLPSKGLRAMNIGHGMGIVDAAIQAHVPSEHHIVEAHPAVLEEMRKNGWFEKPGVFIHQGRWQEVLPRLIEQGVVLDAIYYDTFAEDYKDLRELFSENVISLLDHTGRFGFYNGMGADRRVCYDVYTGVVEIDLADVGFRTRWEDIPVPKVDWKGVRRPYWNVDVYRLPICTFN